MATMLELFTQFASFGSQSVSTEMDGPKFAKMCRDTRLLDKKFTTTDADIIFAKVKAKGLRRIDYAQFCVALTLIADRKKVSEDSIRQLLLGDSSGPLVAQATKIEHSGVYDRLTDSAKYTGAHKERFDEEGHGRGLSGRDVGGKGDGHVPAMGTFGTSTDNSPRRTVFGSAASTEESPASTVPQRNVKFQEPPKPTPTESSAPPLRGNNADPGNSSTVNLVEVFTAYASFGKGAIVADMDGPRFAKLCCECAMLDKLFTATDADLTFAKVKQKGQRKIGYRQFCEALAIAADKKQVHMEDLMHGMLAGAQPLVEQMTPVENDSEENDLVENDSRHRWKTTMKRLMDTTQYTGAHRERFDEEGKGRGALGRELGGKGTGHVPAMGVMGPQYTGSSTAVTPPPRALWRDLISKSQSQASSQSGMSTPCSGATHDEGSLGGLQDASEGQDDEFNLESIRDVFTTFSSFRGGNATSAPGQEMDGPKFAKLCRDCKLIDKLFTVTDADLTFAKVKVKGQRKIRFEQFCDAVYIMAEKKRVEVPKLVTRITKHGVPTVSGAKAETGGLLDKLTDVSLYGGAHKERFDEHGHGRGVQGRDAIGQSPLLLRPTPGHGSTWGHLDEHAPHT
ncbi:hypothetical protein CYMTET_38512 [Cymbomonas tetramitiformis]|uniref:Uncharacterized protein n=1 Tax=Cymbomonas tetramitiformis TaxID=36881 RepID=A0AAE0CBV6_9CHLO|nr:hypothetical protein CYMTET_38512 [Cymbomonas tetramitiformis]